MKKSIFSVFIVLIILLSGCNSTDKSNIKPVKELIIRTENTAIIQEEARQINSEGMKYMSNGEYDKALERYFQALSIDFNNDVYLNNISKAYYELEDYYNASEYAREALDDNHNSYQEYLNYANPLVDLGDFENAIEQYSNAINIKKDSMAAYYGRGVAYFWISDHIKALNDFDEVILLGNKEDDVQEFRAYSLVSLGETNKALDIMVSIFDITEIDKSLDILYDMFDISEDYQKAIEVFGLLDEMYPNVGLLKFNIAKVNYLAGYYNKSLSLFEEYTIEYPDDVNGYIWCVKMAMEIEEFDLAHEWADKMSAVDDKNIAVLNTLAELYFEETEYLTAIKYYEEILERTDDRESAYYGLIRTLMTSKRYSRAVEVSKEAVEEFGNNTNFLGYLGLNYSNIGDSEMAIIQFAAIVRKEPMNDLAYGRAAWEYIMLGDYDTAFTVASTALRINSENEYANKTLKMIELSEESIVDQIEDLFTSYYLYDDYNLDVISEYIDKEELSEKDIEDIFNAIKSSDDKYSFIVIGDSYDDEVEIGDTVSYEYLDENTIYSRIYSFSVNTDLEFINMLDDIVDSKSKHLIIDLRSNGGGDTQSANNILDAMLPTCVTSYLIYKDGYMHSYYSDSSNISFDRISIFIDEKTASASELLTLGLKKYHKNVLVYGRDSVGKGVGQYVYNNPKKKLLIGLVNHYWNVKEANISEAKISPDVYIKGDDLQDFLAITLDN